MTGTRRKIWRRPSYQPPPQRAATFAARLRLRASDPSPHAGLFHWQEAARNRARAKGIGSGEQGANERQCGSVVARLFQPDADECDVLAPTVVGKKLEH